MVARIKLKQISLDTAIKETLLTGYHCNNPELVSEETIQRIKKRVKEKLGKQFNGEYPPKRYRVSG